MLAGGHKIIQTPVSDPKGKSYFASNLLPNELLQLAALEPEWFDLLEPELAAHRTTCSLLVITREEI